MKILFSTNNLPGSIAIRMFTWSDWSHVDLIDGEGCIGAHPFKGVVRSFVSDVLKANRKWAIADVRVPDEPRAWAFARKQLGKPYDYGGIFNFTGVGRNWANDEHWMCSELVFTALVVGGASVYNAEATRITPRDLAISPFITFEESSDG